VAVGQLLRSPAGALIYALEFTASGFGLALLIGLAAAACGTQWSDGTLKYFLGGQPSRGALFAAKTLALAARTCALVLLYTAVIVIETHAQLAVPPVTKTPIAARSETLLPIATGVLAAAAGLAVASLISQLARSTAWTVSAAVLVLLVSLLPIIRSLSGLVLFIDSVLRRPLDQPNPWVTGIAPTSQAVAGPWFDATFAPACLAAAYFSFRLAQARR
jgi:ABC-type transport system involved in multi-copper enzyme maturation permease subunit